MTSGLYAAYVAGWQAHRFCAPRWEVEDCWAIDHKHLAIATEAGTAETENMGSVHEGADPKGIAHPHPANKGHS